MSTFLNRGKFKYHSKVLYLTLNVLLDEFYSRLRKWFVMNQTIQYRPTQTNLIYRITVNFKNYNSSYID